MPDPRAYEIEIRIRSATDEAVRILEGPLDHQSANDVAADVVTHLDSRSRNKLKHIPGTDR